ncbi:MAG TPA: hypothetical protein VFW89_09565 [Gemmatimonadaceae bacterium]|nr:hypothetical protein [Gemmatimonadaceae bacterium]
MQTRRQIFARPGSGRTLLQAVALCSALVLAGCIKGYDATGPGQPADIVGSYSLISVDGAPLPIDVNWNGIPTTLHADTLDFFDAGAFEEVNSLTLQRDTATQLLVNSGTAVQLSGDSVSLGTVLGSGIYANDTITVRTTATYAFGTGRLLVFARF